MARLIGKKDPSTPQSETSVKRRGLLRVATVATALTSASVVSAIGVDTAQAGPGDKTPPNSYVPITEKGAPSGVATLDANSKIFAAQLPDLSASYAPKISTTIDLVRDYGADPTGTTDSSTKMQQAIHDLGLTGGEIILSGRGATFLWLNATPAIRPWMTGRLTIRIAAGVTVKLTNNNRRFLDPGKVADHDIFRKLTITGGGTIDVDSVTGNNHSIFGTLQGGSYMTRVGFEDIVIEDLTVVNAPVDPTMTAHRLHVWLMTKHPASHEAIQDKITNILIRDLRLIGGNAGVGVGAITDDNVHAANVFLDDIIIERCYHDMLAPAKATFYSSNYHVGQSAFGNRVTIRDCVGLYAGDDGIEINGMDSAVVENCRILDSVLIGVLIRNFRPSANPYLQKTTLRNVVVEHRFLGTTSSTPGRGFVYSGTNDLGAIAMENCTYYRNGDAYSDTNNSDEALTLSAPVKSFTSRGLRIVVEGYATTSMKQTLGNALCAFNPSNSPNCYISLYDSDVRVTGVRTAASISYKIWRPFSFSPTGVSEVTLTIDGVVFEYAQTNSVGAGTAQVLCFLGGVVRANVRRLVILGTTDRGITLATITAGVSPASHYRFDGCDSSKITGTEFVVPTAQVPQVTIINHRWKTIPRAAVGVIPDSSPYTYQNLDMTPQWITVQGGNVSDIECSVDGATYWSTGVTQGVLLVQPAEYVRITFASRPSLTKVFAR